MCSFNFLLLYIIFHQYLSFKASTTHTPVRTMIRNNVHNPHSTRPQETVEIISVSSPSWLRILQKTISPTRIPASWRLEKASQIMECNLSPNITKALTVPHGLITAAKNTQRYIKGQKQIMFVSKPQISRKFL